MEKTCDNCGHVCNTPYKDVCGMWKPDYDTLEAENRRLDALVIKHDGGTGKVVTQGSFNALCGQNTELKEQVEKLKQGHCVKRNILNGQCDLETENKKLKKEIEGFKMVIVDRLWEKRHLENECEPKNPCWNCPPKYKDKCREVVNKEISEWFEQARKERGYDEEYRSS